MTPTEVIEICREGIITMLMVATPIMLAALAIGVLISLIQALTQIQEMTLVFVPKIIVTFAIMILLLPFMFSTLRTFTEELFSRMTTLS